MAALADFSMNIRTSTIKVGGNVDIKQDAGIVHVDVTAGRSMSAQYVTGTPVAT